jgi:hypothetical protein
MSVLLFVAAVSTLGLRLPRARGVERQQIKWPAYTAVVATVGNLLYATAISEAIGLRWLEWAGHVVVIATLVGFPSFREYLHRKLSFREHALSATR